MRALKLALATVAAVLVLAAGALVAGPGLLPDERLRATAAALIGGAFDRPVEVAGPVRLALLPTPRLQAERLRIGSPDAAGGGLTAGRLDGRLELLSLLAGDFRFTELDLQDAVLSAAVLPDGTLEAPWPRRPAAAGRLTLTGARLELVDRPSGARVVLAGLDATVAPDAAGLPRLRATLADPRLALGFDGRLTATGLDGRLDVGSALLSGTARLAVDGAVASLTELAVQAGDSRLTGDLRLAADTARGRLTGRLVADRLDLGRAVARAIAADGGLPAALAGRFDAALVLQAESVAWAGLAVGPTAVDLEVAGGRITAALRELGLYGGQLVGRLAFQPGAPDGRLDTAFDVRDVALGPLMAEAAGLAGVSGIARGGVSLVARGGSAAELLASLDGSGRLVVEDAAWRAGEGGGIDAMRVAFTLAGRDRPLLIESGLRLNGRPVRVDASAGPAGLLLLGGRFEAEATLSMPRDGRLHFAAAGAARPFAARGRLSFETRDLADFLGWLGVEPVAAGELAAPARIDGQLAVEGDVLNLRDARFEVAGGTATGRLQVDRSGERPRLAAAFSADTADLRRLVEVATAGGGGLIRAMEGTFDLTAGSLSVGGLEFGRAVLGARIDAGVLSALTRDVALAGGRAGVSVRVDASRPGRLDVEGGLDVADADAAALFGGLTGQPLDGLSGPVSGTLAVQGSGASLQEAAAAATASGELTLAAGELALPGFDAIAMERLRLTLDGLDAPAAVAGTGTWRGDTLAVDGSIGNPRAALAGGDAAVELTLAGDRFTARYDGTVTSPLPAAEGAATLLADAGPATAEPRHRGTEPERQTAEPSPAPAATAAAPVQTAAAQQQAPAARPAQPAMRLMLMAQGGVLRVGNPVTVALTLRRAGHLACFYQSGADDVVRVFPNEAHPDSAVADGEEVRIPDERMGFQIVPDTVGATERFACTHGPAPLVEALPARLRGALVPLGQPLDAVLAHFAGMAGVETATLTVDVEAAAVPPPVRSTAAPRLAPRLTTDRGDAPVVAAGQPLVLLVTAPADGHVACFYRFGDGSLVRVLPNAYAPETRFAADSTTAVPGAGMPFQIVPEQADATERAACLFSRQEILPRLPADLAGPDLEPLAETDLDRLLARVADLDDVGTAQLEIGVRAN